MPSLGRLSDGVGSTVSTGEFLNARFGFAVAPNGDILTVNGNDGETSETKPQGQEVNWLHSDTTGSPRGAGMLFGLAVRPGNKGIYFVDDGQHRLNVSTEHMPSVGAAKPSPLPPQALGLPGQVTARPDCAARSTGAQGATGVCRSGGRSGHRL
jgi:hypothetical protein